jgi:hypothetical protein
MQLLKERVLKEGRNLDNGILKVIHSSTTRSIRN